MSPADAVAAPRWLVGGMAPERETPEVLAEADVPARTVAALTGSGYRVADRAGTRADRSDTRT